MGRTCASTASTHSSSGSDDVPHLLFRRARRLLHADNHATLPDDAVRISRLRHRQLLEAQAQGRQIVANEAGRPVLAPIAPPSLEQMRARRPPPSTGSGAPHQGRGHDRAPDQRQCRDRPGRAGRCHRRRATCRPSEALARRAAIDAIRAASNRAAALIAQMPAANLTDFDATARACGWRADPWPRFPTCPKRPPRWQ
jgi:hypothetical protein